MIFLISMALALLFVLLCGEGIRRQPVPFYLAAVVLGAAVPILTWMKVPMPPIFAKWVWPVFSRGGMAGAIFVLVMITGAFPNGSAPIKRLMPIRGQLSILASILTLGHNIAYGRTYFVRLFTMPDTLPFYQCAAAICSIFMLFIMLPLFVTSFPSVRKKMKAKSWKKLQRLAYFFYALLCIHILLLTIPNAAMGRRGYGLTVFVYGTIFSGYALCRSFKYAAARKRKTDGLARRQIAGGISCMVIVFLVMLCFHAGNRGNGVMASDGSEQKVSAPENMFAESSDLPDSLTKVRRDGVYQGSGMGMNGEIIVGVTISNERIVDITIESERDDEPYITDAFDVIEDILAQNNADVDTISGATYSSGGIIDAVADALEKAERAD